MTGKKFDGGKPRISLVPLKQFWLVIEVLEFGARKYAEDNWKRLWLDDNPSSEVEGPANAE